ncbi:FAD-binding protein [uncultured Cohaesibacter sp.]|uniref:FAD-binding protein n=1 Tax=uncultured Cohaesibacter sp. TaxID=1002546 RepID=UPI00292E11B9|nr:FAD-binding protein [uncultured Cohaesibacter sp.]
MTSLSEMGQTFETDILIVGHGSAGLCAALSAKDANPKLDVMTVDKSVVGFGGKANKGGGHCSFIPEGGEEAYVEYQTRNLGDYISEEHLLRDYASNTRATIERVEGYGVQFYGKEKPFNAHPMIPWSMMTVDLDFMQVLGRQCRRKKVRHLEKVSITDLLTDGDTIVGAMGFSMLTGEVIIIKSKAVIMANGGQNWRIMRMWSSGRGDGIAAAYRAGAKMRNAEFGSFINMISADHHMVVYGAEDHLYNAKGESLTEFARPHMKDNPNLGALGGVDLGGNHALFMFWENQKGNGPIYQNKLENGFATSPIGRNLGPEIGTADPEWFRPVAHDFWHRLHEKKQTAFKNDNVMQEILPGFVGECGPLYVDRSMASNLKGLFAAGDVCACGNGATGAVPTPPGRNRGTGIMWSWFMGLRAGESAADYAGNTEFGQINEDQAEQLRADTFAPLERVGGLPVESVLNELKDVMSAIEFSGWKHEARMTKALDIVLGLKAKLNDVVAPDPHYLMSANELRSGVICAEMFYRAALERKESRGWMIREDYPERDDVNFRKNVVLQDKDGEMSVTLEDLPIETYKYHPDNAPAPVAAE